MIFPFEKLIVVEKKKLKIAILGTRGVPANYGGFETFAEELGSRLVTDGHEVSVYCRRRFFKKDNSKEYKGMKRVVLPAPHHKYLETPIHSLFSFVHLLFHRVDVVLLCNAACSPFAWIGRLADIPLAINVDGVERKRKKWNLLGKLWYRLGEICSVLFANVVVADADVIRDYYKEHYDTESVCIRYGASPIGDIDDSILRELKLFPKGYFLYVARLEPENNALGVIQAYKKAAVNLPLVVVGDAPYASEYIKSLKEAAAGKNVIFTGYRFGDAYKALGKNCYAYIQAGEVGGTHPALLEAMMRGNCIVANSVPEHTEVLGNTGLYYSFNNFEELSQIMEVLQNEPGIVQHYGALAQMRAEECYTWDKIKDQYEDLFTKMQKIS